MSVYHPAKSYPSLDTVGNSPNSVPTTFDTVCFLSLPSLLSNVTSALCNLHSNVTTFELIVSFPALSIAFACTLYSPSGKSVNCLLDCHSPHDSFLNILYKYSFTPEIPTFAPLFAVSIVLAFTVILFEVDVAVMPNAFGAILSTFATSYDVNFTSLLSPSKYLAYTVILSVTLILTFCESTFVHVPSSPSLYCFNNFVYP